MALPKLSGSGMARSAAGAIGKSVRTGTKALGVMALSQMEPEVLTGIATAKMLRGKLKGKKPSNESPSSSTEENTPTDGEIENSQESTNGIESLSHQVEQVPPRTSEPIVQKLEELKNSQESTNGIESLSQQVEEVPPRTSEPIVQKLEELKEAKEAETNLEPVVEKLEELTPMLEKIDILTEQNERDLFSVNLVLDSVDQGITSIESMFRDLLQLKQTDKLNKLEDDREASRKPSGVKSKLSTVLGTKSTSAGGGGIMGTIMSTIMSLLGSGSLIPILGTILTAAGAALVAALPVLLPLVLTAATAAGIWLFLRSELADDITTWLGKLFYDGEQAMEDAKRRAQAIAAAEKLEQQRIEERLARDGVDTPEERAVVRRVTERITETPIPIEAGEGPSNKAREILSRAEKEGDLIFDIEMDKLRTEIETLHQVLLEPVKEGGVGGAGLRTALEVGSWISTWGAGIAGIFSGEGFVNAATEDRKGWQRRNPELNVPFFDSMGITDGTRQIDEVFPEGRWKTESELEDKQALLEDMLRRQFEREKARIAARSLAPNGPTPRTVTPSTPSTGSPVGNGPIQGSPVTSNTTNTNNTFYTSPLDRDPLPFGGTMFPTLA